MKFVKHFFAVMQDFLFQRPLGSFLLKGPTGVGKTETAKYGDTFIQPRGKYHPTGHE